MAILGAVPGRCRSVLMKRAARVPAGRRPRIGGRDRRRGSTHARRRATPRSIAPFCSAMHRRQRLRTFAAPLVVIASQEVLTPGRALDPRSSRASARSSAHEVTRSRTEPRPRSWRPVPRHRVGVVTQTRRTSIGLRPTSTGAGRPSRRYGMPPILAAAQRRSTRRVDAHHHLRSEQETLTGSDVRLALALIPWLVAPPTGRHRLQNPPHGSAGGGAPTRTEYRTGGLRRARY
jgi:hypothetical protein